MEHGQQKIVDALSKKKSRPSIAELSDVLGEPALQGQPLALADVFPLLDIAAGRCAAVHVGGPVVTGCFDDVVVYCQPNHGDVVFVRASVIGIGTRSMFIELEAFREPTVIPKLDAPNGGRVRLIRCLTTFVATALKGTMPVPRESTNLLNATDEVAFNMAQLKPSPLDATMLMKGYKAKRHILQAGRASDIAKIAESSTIYKSLRPVDFNRRVPISATELVVRKQFMKRHHNDAGAVFGGDILHILERTAVSCAARLAGGAACYTTRIQSLTFASPVVAHEAMEIRAKVVATWRREACVVVRAMIDVEHDGSVLKPCHAGVFCVSPVAPNGGALAEPWNRDAAAIGDGPAFAVGVHVVDDVDDSDAVEFYRALAVLQSAPNLDD